MTTMETMESTERESIKHHGQDESPLVTTHNKAANMPTVETRKGKNSTGKTSRKGKTNGEKTPSSVSTSTSNLAPNLASEVNDIKQQLIAITGSLANITPVIAEMKAAYDNFNKVADEMSEDDAADGDDGDLNNDGHDDTNDKATEEPPTKKLKQMSTVLAGMAKMVNKPSHDGEDLESDLSELLEELLSKGASKESREELIEKYPTPANCQRLEVVRVNPEIFNSVKKELKTEDVMLQKAQKPLLKGITAVANVLTKMMKSTNHENQTSTEMAPLMTTLSDSLSLLCDASHEIDLRRRALFKPDMKAEYRLLCSEQHPVQDLLFGNELGKSVKDLTEASKVTSKISSKSNKNKKATSSGNNYSGQRGRYTDQRRSFPFLNQSRGYTGRQSGNTNYNKQKSQYQPRK